MKTFITGTVGACLLLPIIGAGAQAQPANVTPDALARFKLEAVSFRALNETGWDWAGSDEVYVSIHVPARNVATISQVFGDVNAGETTNIPPDQSCILPISGVTGPKTLFAPEGDRWSCSPNGAPGPFSFTVVLREKDDCIHFTSWCGFPVGERPGQEPGPIDRVDDLIGRHKVEYSMGDLIALQVGQVKEESATLSPCTPTPEGPVTGCPSSAAEYRFTWRLTRLPDAEPVVSPVTRRLQEPNPRE